MFSFIGQKSQIEVEWNKKEEIRTKSVKKEYVDQRAQIPKDEGSWMQFMKGVIKIKVKIWGPKCYKLNLRTLIYKY